MQTDLRNPSPRRTVGVLIDLGDSWGRDIVESISFYADQLDWQLVMLSDDPVRFPLSAFDLDGVIAAVQEPGMAQRLLAAGAPVVDVLNRVPDEMGLTRVACDEESIARNAYDHFRSKWYDSFATCVLSEVRPKTESHFVRLVESGGHSCSRLSAPPGDQSSPLDVQLDKWAGQLLKPTAVFCPNPHDARRFAEACACVGIDVPGKIAILAGHEDPLWCGVSHPGLSSVLGPTRKIGRECCARLAESMETGTVSKRVTLLSALCVRTRQSTDVFTVHEALQDANLVQVVRTIQDEAHLKLSVDDLAKKASISRRSLEQRFQKVLGTSPAMLIRRIRLDRARGLIATTDDSIRSIALDCGFCSGPYLSMLFRKTYGIAPSDLR